MDQQALYDARLELVTFLIDAFADVPNEEFVENLLNGDVQLPDEEVNEALDTGFDELRAFIAENEDRDPSDVQDALEREFTRLFIGPRPPVLPHETYYRDDTDFRGEGLAKVEASYGGAGWNPPESYPEENDYIAVELAFLRYLIRQQRSGRVETFGFQRVFHEEHLSEWIGDFVADIREMTNERFYVAVAYVLEGYIEFEEEIAIQMS